MSINILFMTVSGYWNTSGYWYIDGIFLPNYVLIDGRHFSDIIDVRTCGANIGSNLHQVREKQAKTIRS